MAEKPVDSAILGLTAQIVSAHAANNRAWRKRLPRCIRTVYNTLMNIGEAPAAPAEKPQPAVPVRKSVFPDYIICLEDGKTAEDAEAALSTSYQPDT